MINIRTIITQKCNCSNTDIILKLTWIKTGLITSIFQLLFFHWIKNFLDIFYFWLCFSALSQEILNIGIRRRFLHLNQIPHKSPCHGRQKKRHILNSIDTASVKFTGHDITLRINIFRMKMIDSRAFRKIFLSFSASLLSETSDPHVSYLWIWPATCLS